MENISFLLNGECSRGLPCIPFNSTYRHDNYHQMILNRNIRSDPYDHFSHDIEVELYYEYPNLLCELQKLLHCEHELERTAIVSKFG